MPMPIALLSARGYSVGEIWLEDEVYFRLA